MRLAHAWVLPFRQYAAKRGVKGGFSRCERCPFALRFAVYWKPCRAACLAAVRKVLALKDLRMCLAACVAMCGICFVGALPVSCVHGQSPFPAWLASRWAMALRLHARQAINIWFSFSFVLMFAILALTLPDETKHLAAYAAVCFYGMGQFCPWHGLSSEMEWMEFIVLHV